MPCGEIFDAYASRALPARGGGAAASGVTGGDPLTFTVGALVGAAVVSIAVALARVLVRRAGKRWGHGRAAVGLGAFREMTPSAAVGSPAMSRPAGQRA